MDFALYILIAIALYKWWKWRRSSIENRRFIKVQARIIQEKDFEIARRDEMIGILEQRREMAKDVLDAQLIE